MIVPKNTTHIPGEDTPATGLRVVAYPELSDTARRILVYVRDLVAGATTDREIADILLDYRDEALVELVEYNLRAMLATMTPEHQLGALRRVLSDVHERHIVGWATIAPGGANDHLGSLVRYVYGVLGGDPEKPRSIMEYQFWDAGIFTVPLPDEGLNSSYNFADFLRLQHSGGMAMHTNFDNAHMLVSERLIWPLYSIEHLAEEQRVAVEDAKYGADDARRIALLERAASRLLLLLNPLEWICSAPDCTRVVPFRPVDEQEVCACPECGDVFCPEHLRAHADKHAE